MRSFSGTLWVLWLSGVLAGAVTLGVRTVDCWEKNCSLLMYDRYLLQDGTKSKSKGRDEAFGADAKRGKGKGKGKGKTKPEGDCHNCSKPGHWKEDCWADGGGKEGQGPKGRKPRGKKDMSSTSGESSKGNKADVTADDDEEDRKSLRTRTLIWRMEMMRVINLHPLHLSRTGELRDGQFKRASGTSHLTD